MSFRRWKNKYSFNGFGLILTAVAGVGAALLVVSRLDARLHPILTESARTQVSNYITSAIDNEVSEQAIRYSDLVTLERTEAGDIVALTSNMAQANVLRAQLLETTLSALNGLKDMDFEVPLGTVYDWDILSGRGPTVKLRVLYTGTATAEFENSFSDAGINQTCHQIRFRINTDISILLPGRQYRTNVETSVCVAETIIVGKVPETYLNIKQ